MTNVLLIIFIITLFYVAIANRIITFVRVLALQGFILFGVTFLQLKDIQTWNLVLILLETIVFKTIAVPFFLSYLIKRNKITRETEPYLPHFISLIITTLIVVITILLANSIQETHLFFSLLNRLKRVSQFPRLTFHFSRFTYHYLPSPSSRLPMPPRMLPSSLRL